MFALCFRRSTSTLVILALLLILGGAALIFTENHLIYDAIRKPSQAEDGPIRPPVTVSEESALSFPGGWERYTSRKYGYSLEYPEGWDFYASEGKDDNDSEWTEVALTYFGPQQTPNSHPLEDGVMVRIKFVEKVNLPLADWLRERDVRLECTVDSQERVTKSGISGIRRIERCFGWPLPATSYYFLLEREGMVVIFSHFLAHPEPVGERQYELLVAKVYESFQLPYTAF